MVKLLKLDTSKAPPSSGGATLAGREGKSHLALNQSLEGHKGTITKVSWNEKYSKLITADESGLIIVWVLYRGNWFEEMVTRSEGRGSGSTDSVTGLKWSPDGEMIAMLFSGCPSYHFMESSGATYRSSSSSGTNSGSVIIGSVDGKRHWEKDLKAHCEHIEWSPDGKLVLIGILDIEIHVYDVKGQFMNRINVQSVAFDSIAVTDTVSNTKDGASSKDVGGRKSISKNTYSSKVSSGEISRIVSIEWSVLFLKKSSVPTLAIAFESGRIQIMRNEYDDSPLIINSELINANMAWNPEGKYLGVCGYGENQVMSQKSADYQLIVKFFHPDSDHAQLESILINTLCVPGKIIRGLDWDAESLKLALAVDSFVMFANIRTDYKWAFFDSTCVFVRRLSDKILAPESESNQKSFLVFWPLKEDADLSADELASNKGKIKTSHLVMKTVTNLIDVQAHGHYCIYACKIEAPTKSDAKRGETRSRDGGRRRDSSPEEINISHLVICNTLGTPVDSLEIEFAIRSLGINSKFVIAAGRDAFLVWKFSAQNAISDHDHDLDNLIADPATSGFDREKRRSSLFGTNLTTRTISVSSGDILSVTCSESKLIIAMKSKVINVYTLPNINLSASFKIVVHPIKMSLNADSSKLAIIDSNSIISFYDLDNIDNTIGTEDAQTQLNEDSNFAHDQARLKPKNMKTLFEKKDVWNMKWSSDDPDSFSTLEKNKLIIYRNFEPEESGNASGYLASFSDLEIKLIDLDQLMSENTSTADFLALQDYVTVIETKPLKDARELIQKDGVSKAVEIFEKSPPDVTVNNHPKIWRLLASEALKQLNLNVAEHCFVRLKDYKSIQFVKRLSNLSKDELKRAEVNAYFGNFDEAEKVYLDLDRKDLALRMRDMMGQPLRMIQLIKDGAAGQVSDAQMKEIYSNAGDYLFDRFDHQGALKYYKSADNLEGIFTTLMCLEDFDTMSNLIIARNLDKEFAQNDSSTLTPEFKHKLASVFESVGMIKEAVKVYLSLGEPDDAVLACVRLNEWKTAIKLAHDHHDVTDIDQLLNKYANHLMEKKKYFEIIELYRKASRIHDATAILLKLINDSKEFPHQEAPSDVVDLVLMKKLYTLIGILASEEKELSLSERREQLQTARSNRTADHRAPSMQAPSTLGQPMMGPPATAASSRSASRGAPPSTPFGRKKSLATLLASDADEDSLSMISKSDKKSGTVDQFHVAVSRTLDNPWRGAEAFHLMLLTQRLLTHGSDGASELAIKGALRLPDYEDFLPLEDIYCLLALSALISRRFDIASRAFIKLESADLISEERRKRYKELAIEIFSKHAPNSSQPNQVKLDTGRSRSKDKVINDGLIDCSYCEARIPDVATSCPSCSTKFPFCVASGQSIVDPSRSKSCQRCNHKMLINYDHVFNYIHCPLCHYCI